MDSTSNQLYDSNYDDINAIKRLFHSLDINGFGYIYRYSYALFLKNIYLDDDTTDGSNRLFIL